MRFAAIDPRPVQSITDPEFVGAVGPERAERLLLPGCLESHQPGAAEHPLQRARLGLARRRNQGVFVAELAFQHGGLVAQGEDLRVLVPVGQRQQAKHRERVCHTRVSQSQQQAELLVALGQCGIATFLGLAAERSLLKRMGLSGDEDRNALEHCGPGFFVGDGFGDLFSAVEICGDERWGDGLEYEIAIGVVV